jgi:hypothetical protein
MDTGFLPGMIQRRGTSCHLPVCITIIKKTNKGISYLIIFESTDPFLKR